MRLLVTGGAGFIGSNFIRYMLKKYPECQIVNFDKLTYAGNLATVYDIEQKVGKDRYSFIRGDIADSRAVEELLGRGIDAIVNFAAESHVDRSIDNARVFLETNVIGTQVLLDAALRHRGTKFLQVSTDEVYGSLGQSGFFTEETPLAPNSPYAASKAAADLLVRAYYATYGLPVLITRSSNNYGPYQFPEKLIPLFITNALAGIALPLYGDGLYIRDWIFVEDHCAGLDAVLLRGRIGEVYNIGGGCEKTNIEITRTILSSLNKSEDLIQRVKDRPGHDRRYAIDCRKIKCEFGWSPKYDFFAGMKQTISWYLENESWWEKIKTGEYLQFYKRWYGERQ